MLALTGFHNWFKSSIHQWLQIVHERSCDRIRKAVETDKVRARFKASICIYIYIYVFSAVIEQLGNIVSGKLILLSNFIQSLTALVALPVLDEQ